MLVVVVVKCAIRLVQSIVQQELGFRGYQVDHLIIKIVIIYVWKKEVAPTFLLLITYNNNKSKGYSVVNKEAYDSNFEEEVSKLEEGDVLIDEKENEIKVISISNFKSENTEVFNLELEGVENYFANGVLVGN